jgi:hypothetical protein
MNTTKTSEENPITQPAKVLYTAKAHTTGGREFFLPMSGAGFFDLNKGPMFTVYLVMVNLPFGIATALAARAIIGKYP